MIWRHKVQMRRNHFVLHCQNDFHHAGDARRRFEMADVRLHRTNDQRLI